MLNVVQYSRPALPAEETLGDDAPRNAYSFDITQPDARGLVLIDACVPLALAIEFMRLVALYRPA